MRIAVVTLFPEMIEAVTQYGISGRAVEQGLVQVRAVNPRVFTHDRHRTVDDRPYGGGPGMLMKAEPLSAAFTAARAWLGGPSHSVYLSPQGRRLDHAQIQRLAGYGQLILLAGRYEGVDERLLSREVDEELSIGDYVLSGGELAAMVVIDAVTRLLPGTLGHSESATQDSFAGGLLDCPHYTRPEVFGEQPVPEALLSGDHERIRRWRLQQSLGRTLERRPDLLADRVLSEEEQELLARYRRQRNE